jgi:hypothetical protein
MSMKQVFHLLMNFRQTRRLARYESLYSKAPETAGESARLGHVASRVLGISDTEDRQIASLVQMVGDKVGLFALLNAIELSQTTDAFRASLAADRKTYPDQPDLWFVQSSSGLVAAARNLYERRRNKASIASSLHLGYVATLLCPANPDGWGFLQEPDVAGFRHARDSRNQLDEGLAALDQFLCHPDAPPELAMEFNRSARLLREIRDMRNALLEEIGED